MGSDFSLAKNMPEVQGIHLQVLLISVGLCLHFNVVANYSSAETKTQCTVLVNGNLLLSVTNLVSGKQALLKQRLNLELYRKFGL